MAADIVNSADDNTPYTAERFTTEVLELGESAFFEQHSQFVQNATKQLISMGAKSKGPMLAEFDRESVLSPGFDYPTLEEIHNDWGQWLEMFKTSGTVPIEQSMDSHMKENIRKIAEEEAADKKAFEEMK